MAMAAGKGKNKKEKKKEEEDEEVHGLEGKRNGQLGIEFSQFLIGPPLFFFLIGLKRPPCLLLNKGKSKISLH